MRTPPPVDRALDGLRRRHPAADGSGERVWRDDAGVVARRVLPPLALTLVVLVAATTAAGLLLTRVLDHTAVADADVDAVRWLAERRTPALDIVTTVVTWTSNTVFVLVVMVAGAAVAAWATRRWVASVFLLAAVGGEKLAYLLAGLAVGRDRPPVPTVGFVHATTSFPSGHVGAAVALYGAIALLVVWSPGAARRARRAAVVVAVVVPPLVAFARVYRGVHHPSDVLAGAVLGAAWLLVSWYVLARQFSAYERSRPSLHRPAGAGAEREAA